MMEAGLPRFAIKSAGSGLGVFYVPLDDFIQQNHILAVLGTVCRFFLI